MADQSQYKYSAMSNLVLQADRRFVSKRTDEATGDPESLAGRLSIRDMGSRVAREAAPRRPTRRGQLQLERGDIREGEDVLKEQQQRRRRAQASGAAGAPSHAHETGLLGAGEVAVEGITYRPRTAATRETFNLLLTLGTRYLGDVPPEVVRSAVDAVLEYLKDDDLRDADKKREIDEILGLKLSPEEFHQLVSLGKKITDYDAQDDDEEAGAGAREGGEDGEIDDRQGVAVAFDDDGDGDGEDEVVGEVRDVSSGDEGSVNGGGGDGDGDDDDEHDDQAPAADRASVGSSDEDEIVLNAVPKDRDDDGGGDGGGGRRREDEAVPAREIDAYWLQRQIGKIYPDAHEQTDKTKAALRILSGEPDQPEGDEKDLREIENDLMELFEYEHPDLVRKLVKNREKVLWLTRLARAEEGEPRVTVEREMASEGLGWILNELYGRTGGGDEAGRRKIEVKLKSDDTRMDIDSGDTGEQGAAADRDSDGDEKKKQKKKRKDQAGFLVGGLAPRKTINLENLVFEQGNHLMTNAKVRLPEGSTKRTFKGYEEIHVPIPKKRRPEGDGATGEPGLMLVADMPEWAQVPFAKNRTLNRIQTACYASAFGDDGNLLVCAPTGSGKTNVAMLAMLRVIGQHRRPDNGEIDLEGFKIICIAPLKALVQEQVRNYQARLEPYGIRVAELTGDRQLTKQQIAETQVIVTTPEKWDVITRKATDLTYTTSLVRLIVIDEIHLLHDERGPVIESIVSRTIRRGEQHRRSSAGAENSTRIVGLSATLPNYGDVAAFLRVDRDRGLFHFDGSFRPCPLRQEFVGVTDRKAIRQLKVMNEVAYGKVLEHVGKNRNQTLIFVHSRKETARTARYIRDRAVEQDTISQILRQGGDGGGGSTRELLTDAASQASDRDLQDLLPYGFGIHHAGMSRADRSDVEDLFERGAIRVLVCTSTLAWGVNLPAHTVIIKGTQVYLPERGGWVELSPQDVLQMLGRAGRPQYDTYGEGIVITTQSEMPYYLSLLNQQLPIESQLVGRLIDSLNAEVVLGNVRTRDEGVNWLGYTYLYVRMLMAPGLYQVGAEYEDDRFLEQKRVDLVHSAAIALRDSGLARYDAKTGRLQATDLGRIASHYYITHRSMLEYNQHMGPGATAVDLFRIFAKSDEFRHIPVRQDEKAELARLLQRVPVPVKEGVDEPAAKVNVLLQAYISRLRLDGLALMADMVYVTQSAGRVLRAMFEIALRRGWASVATTALDLCKMAEQRMWPTMTPLRQLLLPLNGPGMTAGTGGGAGIGVEAAARIIQKAERVEVPWESYFDLDPPRMGELLGMPKVGRAVCDLVSKFPRLHVRADCRPVTPSLLHFRLTITPKFVWDDSLHGAAQSFWVLLEDGDGEELLWHDQFVLRRDLASAETEHYVDLTVPIADPRPPHYFVSVVSDRWMESRTRMPIVFHRLVLPDRFPPHTELLKLQPLPPAAGLKKGASAGTGAAEAAEAAALLYPGWAAFNQIQSQTFNALYGTDASVFVGAPTGSGKTACAEFALLRLWASSPSLSGPDGGRAVAVYLAPMPDLVELRFRDWHARLSPLRGGREIVRLTGDVAVDLGLLGRADLVLATPREWDALSRQWRRRAAVRAVRLLIADDIHLLGSSPSTSTSSAAAAAGGGGGALYEVVVSRMLQIRAQTSEPLRIVALSVPLADARDLGEWIGAGRHEIYNFNPTVRPIPLALHVQSYSVPHFPSLMLTMAKPAYLAITQLSPTGRAIVFVPNRRQTRATARDLLAACQADADDDEDDDDGDGGEQSDRFLHADRKQLAPILERVGEEALAEALRHGIGYYHEALGAADRRIVRHLFDRGAIQVLVASRDVCWELDCAAHLVIVMGTQYYDGLEHRYVDYPVPDVLQMFGRAVEPSGGDSPQGVLMVPATRREYYKKFLTEALPVESQLPAALSDAFVTEISAGAITSGDDAVNWTTFTYFYRRLLANPTYYSLPGRTHDEVSNYLTDLVEGTLRELADAKLITFDPDGDEEDGTEAGAVAAENAAAIAAYYAVSAATMETFLASLQARTRLRGVLEIVTAASELESVQIRRHEEPLLRRLHDHHLPVKMRDATADSPHFKAFVLLQAHFSRMSLPVDLARDQEVILTRVLPLLHAMVDILASEGHLNATHAMEMCQMVVQAMWDRDSPLKQIPGFGPETVETLKRYNVTNVFEFMEAMDPGNANLVPLIRDIGMDTATLQKVAEFTNNQYPDIDFKKIEVLDPDAIRAGEPAYLTVHLVRTLDIEDDEADDEGEGSEGDGEDGGEGEDKGDDKREGKKKDLPPLDTTVHAPYFPVKKMENWWLVVADHGTASLLGIKRVAVQREATVKIQFTVATAGQHALKLLLISDCYMGCDQEEEFSVTVAEGMEVDGDDDDDEGGGGDGDDSGDD